MGSGCCKAITDHIDPLSHPSIARTYGIESSLLLTWHDTRTDHLPFVAALQERTYSDDEIEFFFPDAKDVAKRDEVERPIRRGRYFGISVLARRCAESVKRWRIMVHKWVNYCTFKDTENKASVKTTASALRQLTTEVEVALFASEHLRAAVLPPKRVVYLQRGGVKQALFAEYDFTPAGDMHTFCHRVRSKGVGDVVESEALMAKWFRPVCEALAAMHEHKISHGDISLGNVLLDADRSSAFLIDCAYSLGVDCKTTESPRGCGTKHFIAPEVLGMWPIPDPVPRAFVPSKYDALVSDVWSLGMLMYAVRTGRRHKTDTPERFIEFFEWHKVGGTVQRSHFVPSGTSLVTVGVTGDFIELLMSMMNPDPSKRLTMQQVLGHPWWQKATTTAATRFPAPTTYDAEFAAWLKEHKTDGATTSDSDASKSVTETKQEVKQETKVEAKVDAETETVQTGSPKRADQGEAGVVTEDKNQAVFAAVVVLHTA